jgi:hypothetical protein
LFEVVCNETCTTKCRGKIFAGFGAFAVHPKLDAHTKHRLHEAASRHLAISERWLAQSRARCSGWLGGWLGGWLDGATQENILCGQRCRTIHRHNQSWRTIYTPDGDTGEPREHEDKQDKSKMAQRYAAAEPLSV